MKKQTKRDRTAQGYYDVKTDAVDRLVSTEAAPPVSGEELRKYTGKRRFHIPAPVKIIGLKFWFAGAACYFFLWGLGMYVHGLDMLFVLAIGLGLVTDLMLNRLLRNMEPTVREYDRWMMVTARSFWSLFLNVMYAGLILFCMIQVYGILNYMLGVNASAGGTEEVAMLGVEPILFGLLYTAFDLLLIGCRNLMQRVIRDAGEKVSAGGR